MLGSVQKAPLNRATIADELELLGEKKSYEAESNSWNKKGYKAIDPDLECSTYSEVTTRNIYERNYDTYRTESQNAEAYAIAMVQQCNFAVDISD